MYYVINQVSKMVFWSISHYNDQLHSSQYLMLPQMCRCAKINLIPLMYALSDQVLGAAYPWISRRLLTQPDPELRATLRQLLYDNNNRFQFERLEQLLEQAAKAAATTPPPAAAVPPVAVAGSSSSSRSSSVLGFSVGSMLRPSGVLGPADGSAAAAGISGRGSAAAAAGGPLALLLSPEGSYVRGILEDELAKGLDAAWRLAADNALQGAVARASQAVAGVGALLPEPLRQQLPEVVAGWLRGSSSSNGKGSSSSRGAAGGAGVAAGERVGHDVNVNITDPVEAQRLLESMISLPKLAADDDAAQIEGITKLAAQLTALSNQQQQQPVGVGTSTSSSRLRGDVPAVAAAGGGGGSGALGGAFEGIEAAGAGLRWFAKEVELLGPEARREALLIPLNILGKLSSRVAARALRSALAPSNGRARSARSSSSSSTVSRGLDGRVAVPGARAAGGIVSSGSGTSAGMATAAAAVATAPVGVAVTRSGSSTDAAAMGLVLGSSSSTVGEVAGERLLSSVKEGSAGAVQPSSSTSGARGSTGSTVGRVGRSPKVATMRPLTSSSSSSTNGSGTDMTSNMGGGVEALDAGALTSTSSSSNNVGSMGVEGVATGNGTGRGNGYAGSSSISSGRSSQLVDGGSGVLSVPTAQQQQKPKQARSFTPVPSKMWGKAPVTPSKAAVAAAVDEVALTAGHGNEVLGAEPGSVEVLQAGAGVLGTGSPTANAGTIVLYGGSVIEGVVVEVVEVVEGDVVVANGGNGGGKGRRRGDEGEVLEAVVYGSTEDRRM